MNKKRSDNKLNIDDKLVLSKENDAENTQEEVKQSFSAKLRQGFCTQIREANWRELIWCVVISWLVVFMLESFGRYSVIETFKFMIFDLDYYFYNFTIVFFFVTLGMFFRRRVFAFAIVLVLWTAMGVTNAIILSFRNTPFVWVDFSIFKSALNLVPVYLNWWQIVGICILVLIGIGLLVIAFRKAPRVKPNYSSATVYQLLAAVLGAITLVCTYSVYSDGSNFTNLPQAYKQYGFAFSFSNSAINRGVPKTPEYSEEYIVSIVNKITKDKKPAQVDVKPNIIYLQLESFFDVKNLIGVEYSEDPVPVFTRLKEECSSGTLQIPGLGGGTCNAEYEMLTGMSVGKFGACEYPYKTITVKQTVGSVCYDLKEQGYSTHAIHNHTGTFYDRHINYANLGFDTFTSVEYMGEVERTPTNWAKDKVLTPEIMKCLDATEGNDFVFAVSVQSHGGYPTQVLDENQKISVTAGMEDEEYRIGFEYFINQLYEMDMFVGDLIAQLEQRDEPTVLVLYGDHLPAMSITEDQLTNGSLYETEYVIWSNYDLPVKDEYLCAYQLSSRVTEMIGFKGNYINMLHRYYKDDKTNSQYSKELQALMYDELYGKKYAYGGRSPYIKTEMIMGIDNLNNPDAAQRTDSLSVNDQQ